MHETSPGQVKKHEISIRRDNKSELDGAKLKINIDMEVKAVKNEFDDDDEEEMVPIYDDPCDLMNDKPIFRMQRSRSWFCCPSSEAPTNQSNNIFYNRCPDNFSLVTEAPTIQLRSVCRRIARKLFFSEKKFNYFCFYHAKLDLHHDVIILFFYFQIQALNNDMIELRARLQKSDLEKQELKMQIRELFDEKDNTQRHLEAINQAHESRVTEMHCVIVELNKKLKVQQDTAIIEETEPEGSGK
jgi:hypothetical protein